MTFPTQTVINSDAPAEFAVEVTPSDSNDLPSIPRTLYIGTGGNISVVMPRGNTVSFANIPSGSFLPIRCTRVRATGTTASGILALA